jgi:hypothetical protein
MGDDCNRMLCLLLPHIQKAESGTNQQLVAYYACALSLKAEVALYPTESSCR